VNTSTPTALAPNARTIAVLACMAFLPVFSSCGGGSEDGEGARTFAADSTVQAILTAAAEEEPTPGTSPRLSPEDQEPQPTDVSSMGYNYGSAEAKVKVLELSDFGCGYCRRFHEEIFPVLKEIYVDGGYIEWKFLPFVLGMFPNGLEAATAAECAGEQEGFFPMKNLLFSSQGEWRGAEDPNSFFAELASEAGLDVSRFNGCVEGGWRDTRLRSNIRLGQQAGVRGTPTFFIDARPLQGALPLNGMRDILDTALRMKGVTPPPR
jgi:protein-disulfide isomerase